MCHWLRCFSKSFINKAYIFPYLRTSKYKSMEQQWPLEEFHVLFFLVPFNFEMYVTLDWYSFFIIWMVAFWNLEFWNWFCSVGSAVQVFCYCILHVPWRDKCHCHNKEDIAMILGSGNDHYWSWKWCWHE